jgi:hypothetical protein
VIDVDAVDGREQRPTAIGEERGAIGKQPMHDVGGAAAERG